MILTIPAANIRYIDTFQSIIIFRADYWSQGYIYIYIQKLSDDILSVVKLKIKVNFQVKYDFEKIKLGKSVIPNFREILTGKFISDINFMIQDKNGNFKVK